LDPRNVFILQQIALACENMRRFDEAASVMDRVLHLTPKDAGSRVERAMIELDARADAQPLQLAIRSVISEDPNAAGGVAEPWLFLALCQRDWSGTRNALAAMTGDGCRLEGVPFPRTWCEAVEARARGDTEQMRAALSSARIEIDRVVRDQPNYAEALCVLGLIDAGLGHRAEGIREGARAAELLPIAQDAINGPLIVEYLALIYAWCGDNDHAIEQLTKAASVPCDVNYGALKLHPHWDPLRGDARFEKLVASMASPGGPPH
jgi:tetratricopeptide (TPR) repeat protein